MIPEKQERYAQYLRSRKHRKKLLDRLNHNADFNPKFLLRVANDDQSELAILALLQRRGAPDECYVISTNENIDGRRMPLVQALSKTVEMGYGTVISCIPGKLAYYEGEEPGERYLLVCPMNERPARVPGKADVQCAEVVITASKPSDATPSGQLAQTFEHRRIGNTELQPRGQRTCGYRRNTTLHAAV